MGVTGLIGSGKDMFCDYIEKKYGFLHLSTGYLAREECVKIFKLPLGRQNEIWVGKKRISEDNAYWPKLLIKRIKEEDTERVVHNGVRQIYDYQVLKDHFGEDYKLILIDTDTQIRFKRLNSRGREKDPETFEEFQSQNEKEEEVFHTKKDVFSKVDYKITNNFNNLEDFHKEIDNLMERIK